MAKDKFDAIAYQAIEEYQRLYRKKYSKSILVNKYKEKWAMKQLIEDFGRDDVFHVLEYYFKTAKEGHPLNWLYNNYITVRESYMSYNRDLELREQRREETRKMKQEWLNGLS